MRSATVRPAPFFIFGSLPAILHLADLPSSLLCLKANRAVATNNSLFKRVIPAPAITAYCPSNSLRPTSRCLTNSLERIIPAPSTNCLPSKQFSVDDLHTCDQHFFTKNVHNKSFVCKHVAYKKVSSSFSFNFIRFVFSFNNNGSYFYNRSSLGVWHKSFGIQGR